MKVVRSFQELFTQDLLKVNQLDRLFKLLKNLSHLIKLLVHAAARIAIQLTVGGLKCTRKRV